MFEEYNNGVPDRLRQVTAETMSPEVLYTLDTYSDVSPQDVIYIDESRAEGSGRLLSVKDSLLSCLRRLICLLLIW